MIGSHDSFTYLNPIHNIFKLFKFLWRTQTKTITEQYNYGVRYFDIRVKYKRNRWYVCHGLVTFNVSFASLKHIIDFFNLHYPDSKLRIIYEKGNFEDIFKQERRELLDNETLCYAYKKLDKALAKGIVHKNYVARHKSELATAVNTLK